MAEGLRVIGICLYDEKGEMRNFKDVVDDLAQKWDSIDCNSYTGADTGNENGSTKFLNQNVEIPVRGLRAQADVIDEANDSVLFDNEDLFKDWFTELDLTNPFLQGDTEDEK